MKSSLILMILFCCSFLKAQTVSKFIVTDQFGYRPGAKKIVVVRDPEVGYDGSESFIPGITYALVNTLNNTSVFSGKLQAWQEGFTDTLSGDKAWWFDFSQFTQPGSYFVLDVENNVRSFTFEIRDDIYNEVLKHAFRTFFYQRSGFAKNQPYADVAWADEASHIGPLQDKNCRHYLSMNDASTEKDLHGGWYDAGDENKYTSWTAGYISEMLKMYEENTSVWTDNFNIPESGNGIPDILDEAKWGLDHLLRLQNDDGSLIALVGVESASPPSSATQPSKYSNVNTSATRRAASAYAFGARIFRKLGLKCYADTLENAAERAWNWAEENPDVVWSNVGTGVGAGDPEVNDYGRFIMKLEAAIQLFALKGVVKYRDFFDKNYQQAHLVQWTYAFPYEHYEQEVLLYYTTIPGATASVVSSIKSIYKTAISGETNFGAVDNVASPYLAYQDSYVWGSNNVKSMKGLMFYEVSKYDINAERSEDAMDVAENFLHYMHGVNPVNFCFLTNMNKYGADNSVTQIYHSWFSDGSSLWDQTGVSTYGPPPGFLAGGPNKEYELDACCPAGCGSNQNNALCNNDVAKSALDQPPMKSYADINDGWPVNSWALTENSCGYQVSYIRLLSKFVKASGEAQKEIADPSCFISGIEISNNIFSMAPNPFSISVNIKHEGIFDYTIHTVSGILKESGTGIDEINAGNSLNAGIFFLTVKSKHGTSVRKIIKN